MYVEISSASCYILVFTRSCQFGSTSMSVAVYQVCLSICLGLILCLVVILCLSVCMQLISKVSVWNAFVGMAVCMLIGCA